MGDRKFDLQLLSRYCSMENCPNRSAPEIHFARALSNQQTTLALAYLQLMIFGKIFGKIFAYVAIFYSNHRGLCMLGVILLVAFTHLGRIYRDL